jgi:hypothetical protein
MPDLLSTLKEGRLLSKSVEGPLVPVGQAIEYEPELFTRAAVERRLAWLVRHLDNALCVGHDMSALVLRQSLDCSRQGRPEGA